MGYSHKKGNYSKKENQLSSIIYEIENSKSLKEVFVPEKYALPGGWAEKVSKVLTKVNKNEGMNNNQLRKIFTQIKSIEEDLKRNKDKFNIYRNQIFMLMPQVAYALGRNVITEDFYDLMKACINPRKIKDQEDYCSFVSFYTAIVAYFKAESVR